MKEYCLNSKSNDINYELIGICIHNGGLNGGHYYAICKNIEDKNINIIRKPGPMKHGKTVIAFIEDPNGYKIELIQR